MRFLYIAISYPDVEHTTSMYTSLVKGLVSAGHEVRVIAPTFKGVTQVSLEGGIPVLRVRSGQIFATHLIIKGFNTILLNARYTRAFRRFWTNWSMDWILTSTPPITLSPLLSKLKVKYNAKIYLILRDIFPQNAKDLSLINNSLLFCYFRHRERQLYDISDIIGCMSPANISFLQRQDPEICNAKKLKDFPNWIKPTSFKDTQKGRINLRSCFNLEGKFVAVFGGNFGIPQQVDFIIDLAASVQNLTDVVFFLIGDGTEKKRIMRIVQERCLKNVTFCDPLPREDYQSLIQEADIGLVCLNSRFTIPNIPSRTLGYWDACLPVLAATDRFTDYNCNILEKYNAGLWAETGDIVTFKHQFMKLYTDRKLRETMGINGKNAVNSVFSLQSAVRRMMEQIEECVAMEKVG